MSDLLQAAKAAQEKRERAHREGKTQMRGGRSGDIGDPVDDAGTRVVPAAAVAFESAMAGLEAFANALDRLTKSEEGTTWARFLERRAMTGNRLHPENRIERHLSQHKGSGGCKACGGSGWAPMVADQGQGRENVTLGLSHCMDCGYWEKAIEAGVRLYKGNVKYRRVVEERARTGDTWNSGVQNGRNRNPIAEAIVKRATQPASSRGAVGEMGKMEF